MTTLSGSDLVDAARRLATTSHEGQVDKAGKPYITHPARVARRVEASYGPEVQAVAWLHDVIEDCDVTADDLAAQGFAPDVVAGVVAMTKVEGDGRDDAVLRACADPIALVVKAADVADNTDPARLEQVDAATRTRLVVKYARYRQLLDGNAAPCFPESVDL